MNPQDKELVNALIIKTDSIMNSVSTLQKDFIEQLKTQKTSDILEKIQTLYQASNKNCEAIADLYKSIAILLESQKGLKKDIEQILNWTRMN